MTFALDDQSVVVIIGSGASGGTLANELAQQGIDVVCLEAGPRLETKDFVNDEADMFPKLTWLDERIGEGDTIPPFPMWTCKAVGGTTMHWTAACPRLQPHEMRARCTYGALAGTSLVDWPITAEELAPFYDRAEDQLGVTGTHGIERLPGNNNYRVLEAAAKAVGYKDVNTNNMAINSAPRDGRPGCLQLGFCTSGCVIGAKWSPLYGEIPAAEATGHFELRPNSMAVRITHDNRGRANAVEYLDAAGTRHRQKASAICVAANVADTTRLLLVSTSNQFPAGLANSCGLVGHNYMHHEHVTFAGIMPGPVNMHRGAHMAGIVKDEAAHDPSRGFAGGFIIATVPFSPETLARLLAPRMWGKRMAHMLDNYQNLAMMMAIGEDPPLDSNRITLHPNKKDQYGLPVPVIRYKKHDNTRAMVQHMRNCAHKLYRALDATEIYDMVDMMPGTHNMGTARMGEDPDHSVCNPWGQTHDVENLFVSDGSLFPTAGCENPTITIVALALRQAEYLTTLKREGRI